MGDAGRLHRSSKPPPRRCRSELNPEAPAYNADCVRSWQWRCPKETVVENGRRPDGLLQLSALQYGLVRLIKPMICHECCTFKRAGVTRLKSDDLAMAGLKVASSRESGWAD